MADPIALEFGTWPSPLSVEDAVAGAPRFGDLCIAPDGSSVWWTESRPAEAGRSALVHAALPHGQLNDGSRVEGDAASTPVQGGLSDLAVGMSVRTRVNEYGGGAFWLGKHAGSAEGPTPDLVPAPDLLVVIDDADARPWLVASDPNSGAVEPLPLAPLPPESRAWRYAAGASDPDGRWCVVERERHVDATGAAFPEAVNDLAVLMLDGHQPPETLLGPGDLGGGDFVAAPAVAPDGRRLAWLRWDHPDMPWDSAELWVGDLMSDAGSLTLVNRRRVVGGRAIGRPVGACLPAFAPDGALWWCDDSQDWWQLRRLSGDLGEGSGDYVPPMFDREADVGEPRWVSGGSRFGFLNDGRVVFAALANGFSSLHVLDPATGVVAAVAPGELRYVESLVAAGRNVAVIGGGPDRLSSVVVIDIDSGTLTDLRPSPPLLDGKSISFPKHVTFPTSPSPDGSPEVAHAVFYAPKCAGITGPSDAAPPLIIRIHGGPTASARTELSSSVQFWTTRGFAVADVNYRGSTGYGRRYRDLLQGQWGIADVADCLSIAEYLADLGLVDGQRCMIRGGSAGGFTALAALCSAAEMGYGDVLAGAVSLYGVTDLLTLDDGTHKFESRYNDSLVGPRPECDELYRQRSPLTNAHKITSPVLVLQGTDDLVVPLEQAEALVAVLRHNSVLHDYLIMEGEGHGFRRTDTLIAALTAELDFYMDLLRSGRGSA